MRETIVQACAELKTPVEHMWMGWGPDANQIALFLDIETPGASLAAGVSVGTLVASRVAALRFEGPSLMS